LIKKKKKEKKIIKKMYTNHVQDIQLIWVLGRKKKNKKRIPPQALAC
jgi:hypothetical protein